MVITILYTSSQLIKLFGLEEPRLQMITETFGKQIRMGLKQNYGLKTWIPLNFTKVLYKLLLVFGSKLFECKQAEICKK